jgi:hypothetical protein
MTSKGEGGIGTLLSIVALVAIGVFLFWLYQESGQIESTADDQAIEQVALDAGDILANPAAAVGRRASIDSISVATGLGQGAFALNLSETFAYPVLMSADAIQRLRGTGVSVFGGDMVYVEGQVYTLNDSIASAWIQEGAVDQAMAGSLPATVSFLLADSVVVY